MCAATRPGSGEHVIVEKRRSRRPRRRATRCCGRTTRPERPRSARVAREPRAHRPVHGRPPRRRQRPRRARPRTIRIDLRRKALEARPQHRTPPSVGMTTETTLTWRASPPAPTGRPCRAGRSAAARPGARRSCGPPRRARSRCTSSRRATRPAPGTRPAVSARRSDRTVISFTCIVSSIGLARVPRPGAPASGRERRWSR